MKKFLKDVAYVLLTIGAVWLALVVVGHAFTIIGETPAEDFAAFITVCQDNEWSDLLCSIAWGGR